MNGHSGECQYSRMAGVMEQLDAAHNELLDKDNKLVGCVKDKEEVEKCLRHKLLPLNVWLLIPFFKLFMSSPKDELHQWLVICSCMYMTVLGMYLYVLYVLGMYHHVPSTYCTCILTHFTGAWASLETTLSQLFSIIIPRFCGVLTSLTAKASHWLQQQDLTL